MKRIILTITALIMLAVSFGCGNIPTEDFEDTNNPGGLFSKKTTAVNDTVQADYDMDAFRSYQLSEKYDYILSDFGGWEDKNEVLKRLDKTYNNILGYYSSSLDKLTDNKQNTGKVTFITSRGYNELMKYSPLAAALYQYRNKLSSNPAAVVDKLTEISRHKNSPVEFSSYYIDRSGATRDARLYSSPQQLIREFLRSYVAPLDYEVNYSASENLYYVYMISGEENISASAVYFCFEDDVLRRVGIDNVIYTGGQLAIADTSQKYAHEKPLDDDMTENGPYMYYGSEKNTLNNLTDMATSMLGSSKYSRKLVTSGKVTSEDMLRLDYTMTDKDAPYGVKGVYYSTWFTLS